jgi:gamma-glutamyltranspeptidase/glutathione hydrolase
MFAIFRRSHINRFVIALAIALASVASFDLLTSHTLAAPQRNPRNGPVVRPGAPEPILGGTRPPVIGSSGGVSAGHPLTSAAGLEILQRGGNAFDAGVAAVLAGGVVEQDLFSLGGETLVLVYPVKEKKVTSVVGQGWEPKGGSIEWYKSRGKTLEGEGLDPSVVPGSLHAALTVLEKWGSMSFEQVSARAIAYAEQGFPMRPRTAETITRNLEFFKKWPDNERYWLKPDGSMYLPGETIKLPTLANTLKKMVEAERKAKKKGRAAAVVRRAIVSTRATSPIPWFRFCRNTRLPTIRATSPSSSR